MFSSLPTVQPWIVRPSPRPSAALRLVCFPRAGGGISSFRRWPEEAHPSLEIALFQSPGREIRLREQPLGSMPTLAAAAADALTPLLDRPCAFFGHSLGAKVAFETARELRRRGLSQPTGLFVAASAGPAVPWSHSPLHALSDADLLRNISERYGGVPQEILADQELCALLVPGLRADDSGTFGFVVGGM